MGAQTTAEIQELMRRYFDGLYHSNSQVLRTVFHSDLVYVNGSPGDYEHMGLDAYMARIDARTPPASRGDPRVESVDRITIKADRIGVVEARMTMMGRDYQDLLTVIDTGDGWRILTKTFTFDAERR